MPTWQRTSVPPLGKSHSSLRCPSSISLSLHSLSLSLGFPSRSSLSTYYTNPHFRFRFCLSRFETLFAEMSKAGALDLASGVGGKIQKDEIVEIAIWLTWAAVGPLFGLCTE
ncbi:hypothetical protein CK203_057224 [Vitis vinifera]|uniref:Uncharacterized protein n=1 Tax=Vitis vinifera TaxID=29760 RepID=A0A438HTD7_VITVI|nr:hypothetical protein CK203_057224 [Vitis vinifera]